jgi:signal transduction histidine kinase
MNVNKILEINTSDTMLSSTPRLCGPIKWLEIVHGIVHILRNNNVHWQDPLISFLSTCWNFPQQTPVRIQIGDLEYCSNNFKDTSQRLFTSFDLANGVHGTIEIFGAERDEEQFLSQEQEVLDSIGDMIGFAIDAHNAIAKVHIKEIALISSHERIKDLAGRLIQAQEIERTRIARELHDNINQQIAALSISLSNVKKKLNGSSSNIVEDITALQRKLSEIAAEVRGVSHNLHSGVLKHAGLVTAAKSMCTEFSTRYGIDVQFTTMGDVDDVSTEIALCAYRVIQEGMHNIEAHARARNVKVSLIRSSQALRLFIFDDGCGFDQNDRNNHSGLGLLSMTERVRQVHGQISIDSQIDRGTQIFVEIPVQNIRKGTEPDHKNGRIHVQS